MSEFWKLPQLDAITNTGRDWLLILVGGLDKDTIDMILMLLWRIWFVRNEIVHDKIPPPLDVSCRFLISYLSSLVQVKYFPNENYVKGKFSLDRNSKLQPTSVSLEAPSRRWNPPDPGWFKLNTDGSFTTDGVASTGMILRDQ